MLTRAQEKLIKSLHRKKGRAESGFCLVEGEKVIEAAGEDAIEYRFTPQDVAAVAKIPVFSKEQIFGGRTVIVLDGVQDPGNVGAIFRLCQGFDATLVLIESADPSSSKVIRSSVGAIFHVPWAAMNRPEAHALLSTIESHHLFRLEKTDRGQGIETFVTEKPAMLVVGSEGQGIQLSLQGPSVSIMHNEALESLNVGNAVAIALHTRFHG
jgi:TrmH family RNA methyltransferase